MNKIFKNAFWIIACKVLQMGLNLIVTMLTARYLGPSNYGLINYAASITTFVVPVMQLGLRSTIVQEIVNGPDKEGKIVGTSVVLNIIGALACIVGIISFASFANAGETETIIVCGIYSLSLIFQATEIVQYWFQAKLKSKYPSMAMLASYVVVSAYKIFLLATGKSVYWFAFSQTIDAFFISVILFYFYKKQGEQRLSVSFKLGAKMFDKSRYYIVSGLMVNIFQLTDKVMIKLMLGDTMNGYYSAAVACASLTNFVFLAIIDSYRPSILGSYKEKSEGFEKGMINLFSIMIYLSLAQSVAITVLAKPIVLILYGSQYMESVNVLRMVVWYLTFAYLGTVRNIWILAEGKQNVLWKINLFGAMANVIMNYMFIPVLGIYGAAIASVITQFFTNVILGELIKPIRPCNRLMYEAVKPKYIIHLVQTVIRSRRKRG